MKDAVTLFGPLIGALISWGVAYELRDRKLLSAPLWILGALLMWYWAGGLP